MIWKICEAVCSFRNDPAAFIERKNALGAGDGVEGACRCGLSPRFRFRGYLLLREIVPAKARERRWHRPDSAASCPAFARRLQLPSMTPCSKIASLCVLILSVSLPRTARAQLTEYGVGEIGQYTQTDNGVVAANPGAPYEFAAEASYQGTVTTPANQVVPLSIPTTDGLYEAYQVFSTEAAMDAAFPSGTYQFNVFTQGPVDVGLNGNLFPPIPEVVNGVWSGGDLLVDPQSDFFISFIPFVGYSTVGVEGAVLVSISQPAGPDPLDSTWYSSQSPMPPNGITIPADTLSDGGFYSLTLTYIQYSSADATSVPGSFFFAAYERTTSITIVAQTLEAVPPTATSQPQSQIIPVGATVVFKFAASGSPNPTYQWYFNGSPLAATQPTLSVSGASAANAGGYYCVATNAAGSVRSATATLVVSGTNDIGRLVNISCRSLVGTGANLMIAGIVVGGAGTSGSEGLLIRASGPALAKYSVPGTLTDPQLSIFSGSSELDSNDGWGGRAAISGAAAQVNAFAWTSAASLDSALLETLGAGAYTAQIVGASGDTGVALVEVYDTTPAGTYTPSLPRLVNISARVEVGTGGNILIAGFVIGGSTSRTVLIRASGPALIPFGVPGTLPDPQLELYSGSNVIAGNSGWGGDPAIESAAESVNAFSWLDSSSTDSAILVTLPPGAYTAQISGASGDTGVALVEVYEVP
jgi:hypothetical protein